MSEYAEESQEGLAQSKIGSKNTIKVMHVFVSFDVGGAENGVINLINHKKSERISYAVCVLTDRTNARNRIKKSDIGLHCCFKTKGVSELKIISRLTKLFVKEAVQVVHTHSWGPFFEGVVAAKLAGVPVIIHGEHGTLPIELPRRKLTYRFLSYFVDGILSVSKHLSARLVNEAGISNKKISIIPNGVNKKQFDVTNEYFDVDRKNLEVNGDFVIGTVGRLIPVKDYATVIRSIKILLDRGHHVKYLMIGDGPERAALENSSKSLGLEERIVFMGHVDEVALYYSQMDVFVCSSLYEGMSNTILEAMAFGLPVVASKVGGTVEIVQHEKTGLLVKVRNEEDLADTLEKLIFDKDLKERLGRGGLHRVKQEFTIDKMVQRYETYYQEQWDKKMGRSAGSGSC